MIAASINSYLSRCKLRFCIIFFLLTIGQSALCNGELLSIAAQREASIEYYCDANQSAFRQCFEMEPNECKVFIKEAHIQCDPNYGIDYFDSKTQEELESFSACFNQRLSSYVIQRGLDLGGNCE